MYAITAYGICIMLNVCVYTDQLQGDLGESSVTEFQPSTKKRLVESSEGKLSIEVPENPISKFILYLHRYLPISILDIWLVKHVL